MKKLLFFISLLLLSSTYSHAQTGREKQKILKATNVKVLKELEARFSKKYKENKAYALKLAKEKGWPVEIERDGVYMELEEVSEEGIPIYTTTYNVDAARSTRTNTLHNGGLLNLNLEGQGMTIHIWDRALARATHREYDGPGGDNRYSAGDDTDELSDHSAHVAGTVIASGVDQDAKGMAPRARAVGYSWDDDAAEATAAAANDAMLVSNHSYGWVASRIPDKWFGQYRDKSSTWDTIMYNAPYYLMVVAAGNDGDDNESNASPLDNNSNYDKLSGRATAKNNLVVADAQDANIDDDGNLVSVTIHSSSSEGPTDDYRIKPDITGNGDHVYSTQEESDDDYGTKTGTSMASPNVSGTLLLLQEHYHNLNNNNYMRAATLKGLALHTADDAGMDGPDAIYGWGLLNAKKAAETITDRGTSTIMDERSLANGGSYTINVIASGDEPLKASISWTDVPGAPIDNLNDHTAVLVNDLDLRIVRGDSTHLPYKLTSVSENARGDNTVDPYERIDIGDANAGDVYTITVTHKGNLANAQNYSLIVTGIIVPGDNPSVVTGNVSNITASSASVAGNVVHPGASNVTERGIVWGTSKNPTVNDHKVQDANNGTGAFSVNITGLNSSTTYYARAYAINGNGTSYGKNKKFTTLCGIVTEFPFTEDFEDGALPDCWSNEYVTNEQDWEYTDGGHDNHPAHAHGGSHNALFYHGSTSANVTKLVTPPMDFSNATSANLKFWHVQPKWESDQDELRIYYKTTADGDWTLLETYTSNVTAWTERNLALPNLSSTYYIAFQATGKYGYGVGIDDVKISMVPDDGKPKVTTGTVTSITGSSATVAGNVTDAGSSNVTERGVCWGTSQNPTTSDSHASNGSGTGNYTVNLTNLDANTTYYVRAYATNTQGTSYGENVSFKTLCGLITSFPFTEGFEGGELPDCWTNEHVTDTQDWDYDDGGHSGNPSHAHTGDYNALFYNGSTNANVTKLVTPPMDLSNVASASLNFWHVQAKWSPDQDELRVYYKTAANADWTLLQEYTSNITNWTERNINLPNLSGQYYIAFEATGKYGYGVGVDDVQVSVTQNHPVASVNDEISNNIKVMSNNGIFTFISDTYNIKQISVFSLEGKLLLHTNAKQPIGVIRVNMAPFAHQVLIFKITTDNDKIAIIKGIR